MSYSSYECRLVVTAMVAAGILVQQLLAMAVVVAVPIAVAAT